MSNAETRSSQLRFPQYWFGRLNVALCIGALAMISAVADGTLLNNSVIASGPAGVWCVLSLALLACFAVIDVVINDLMPERFRLGYIKRKRHLIYMALGIGMASLGFIIAQVNGASAVHVLIFINAFSAVAVAFLDLNSRHKAS